MTPIDNLSSSEALPDQNSLGRIIFERKPHPGLIIIYYIGIVLFGLFAIAGPVVMYGASTSGGRELGSEWVFILFSFLFFMGCVVFFILGAMHHGRKAFRCHELGVYQSGLLGERRLRYSDVASFTYSATRVYVNSNYTGTTLILTFDPFSGNDRPRISFKTSVKQGDQELENLHNHIAQMIARRMADTLAAGTTVPWTMHLRFLPNQGIEHEPSGFLGRKESILIPFADIVSYDIKQGVFSIWVKDKKKPVVQERVAEPNFFPGFFLFLTLTKAVTTPTP